MGATLVNRSETVYEDFRSLARKTERKASELIREEMELYRQQVLQRKASLLDRRPASVGGPIAEIAEDDDILGGMLDDV